MQKKRKINVHIIGAGGIGIALAGQLSQDNCSVTVVDTDAAVVTAISQHAGRLLLSRQRRLVPRCGRWGPRRRYFYRRHRFR